MSLRERRMGGTDGRMGGLLSGRARALQAASEVTSLSYVRRADGSSTLDRTAVLGELANVSVRDMLDIAATKRALAEAMAENERLKAAASSQKASTASAPSRAADVSLASVPTPRAASAPLRARGQTPDDRAQLMSVPRGKEVVVKVAAKYRNGYTFGDVCRTGQAIADEVITVWDLRKRDVVDDYKVPCGTMRRWLEADYQGAPKWRVELECRSRKELKKMGANTVLPATAEKELMLTIARAAKAHLPYRSSEVELLVRNVLIKLELRVKRTGELYSPLTDVSTLVAGFLRRCAEAGVFLIEKHGRKLGMQRAINQNRAALEAYAAKINPALIKYQEKKGEIPLGGVGNLDETG